MTLKQSRTGRSQSGPPFVLTSDFANAMAAVYCREIDRSAGFDGLRWPFPFQESAELPEYLKACLPDSRPGFRQSTASLEAIASDRCSDVRLKHACITILELRCPDGPRPDLH